MLYTHIYRETNIKEQKGKKCKKYQQGPTAKKSHIKSRFLSSQTNNISIKSIRTRAAIKQTRTHTRARTTYHTRAQCAQPAFAHACTILFFFIAVEKCNDYSRQL